MCARLQTPHVARGDLRICCMNAAIPYVICCMLMCEQELTCCIQLVSKQCTLTVVQHMQYQVLYTYIYIHFVDCISKLIQVVYPVCSVRTFYMIQQRCKLIITTSLLANILLQMLDSVRSHTGSACHLAVASLRCSLRV
jgi:hypothetical protein